MFEVRSSNIGSWDIIDRTGDASRLEINTNGNFGFNTSSGAGFGGDVKVLQIANCSTVPLQILREVASCIVMQVP